MATKTKPQPKKSPGAAVASTLGGAFNSGLGALTRMTQPAPQQRSNAAPLQQFDPMDVALQQAGVQGLLNKRALQDPRNNPNWSAQLSEPFTRDGRLMEEGFSAPIVADLLKEGWDAGSRLVAATGLPTRLAQMEAQDPIEAAIKKEKANAAARQSPFGPRGQQILPAQQQAQQSPFGRRGQEKQRQGFQSRAERAPSPEKAKQYAQDALQKAPSPFNPVDAMGLRKVPGLNNEFPTAYEAVIAEGGTPALGMIMEFLAPGSIGEVASLGRGVGRLLGGAARGGAGVVDDIVRGGQKAMQGRQMQAVQRAMMEPTGPMPGILDKSLQARVAKSPGGVPMNSLAESTTGANVPGSLYNQAGVERRNIARAGVPSNPSYETLPISRLDNQFGADRVRPATPDEPISGQVVEPPSTAPLTDSDLGSSSPWANSQWSGAQSGQFIKPAYEAPPVTTPASTFLDATPLDQRRYPRPATRQVRGPAQLAMRQGAPSPLQPPGSSEPLLTSSLGQAQPPAGPLGAPLEQVDGRVIERLEPKLREQPGRPRLEAPPGQSNISLAPTSRLAQQPSALPDDGSFRYGAVPPDSSDAWKFGPVPGREADLALPDPMLPGPNVAPPMLESDLEQQRIIDWLTGEVAKEDAARRAASQQLSDEARIISDRLATEAELKAMSTGPRRRQEALLNEPLSEKAMLGETPEGAKWVQPAPREAAPIRWMQEDGTQRPLSYDPSNVDAELEASLQQAQEAYDQARVRTLTGAKAPEDPGTMGWKPLEDGTVRPQNIPSPTIRAERKLSQAVSADMAGSVARIREMIGSGADDATVARAIQEAAPQVAPQTATREAVSSAATKLPQAAETASQAASQTEPQGRRAIPVRPPRDPKQPRPFAAAASPAGAKPKLDSAASPDSGALEPVRANSQSVPTRPAASESAPSAVVPGDAAPPRSGRRPISKLTRAAAGAAVGIATVAAAPSDEGGEWPLAAKIAAGAAVGLGGQALARRLDNVIRGSKAYKGVVERSVRGGVVREVKRYLSATQNADKDVVAHLDAMQAGVQETARRASDEVVPALLQTKGYRVRHGAQAKTGIKRSIAMALAGIGDTLSMIGQAPIRQRQLMGAMLQDPKLRASIKSGIANGTIKLPQSVVDAVDDVRRIIDDHSVKIVTNALAVDTDVYRALSENEQKLFHDLVLGRNRNTGQVVGQLTPQQIQNARNLAASSIRELRNAGVIKVTKSGKTEIVDNVLDPDLMQSQLGQYMPWLHKFFEVDAGSSLRQYREQLVSQAMQAKVPPEIVNLIENLYGEVGVAQSRSVATLSDVQRFLKRNKDLPAELRTALGFITDPAYPVAKGLHQMRQAAEQIKMARAITSSKDALGRSRFVSDIKVSAHKPDMPAPRTEDGRQMVPVPESMGKTWKGLADRFVDPDVIDFFDAQGLIHKAADSTAEHAWDAFQWLKSKFVKNRLILNPGSHAAQWLGNGHQQWVAGMGSLRGLIGGAGGSELSKGFRDFLGNLPPVAATTIAYRNWRALQDLTTHSDWYKAAREHGIIGAGGHSHDVQRLASGFWDANFAPNWMERTAQAKLEKLTSSKSTLAQLAGRSLGMAYAIGKHGSATAGKLFSLGDDVARLSMFRYFVEAEGMSMADAAAAVQYELGDFSKRSRVTQMARGGTVRDREHGFIGGAMQATGAVFGQPFFGYSAWSGPRAVKDALGVGRGRVMAGTDLGRAMRFWSVPAFGLGVTAWAANERGMTLEELRQEMPDYAQSVIGGAHIAIPGQLMQMIGEDGNELYTLDLARMLPYNDFIRVNYDPTSYTGLSNAKMPILGGLNPVIAPLIETMVTGRTFFDNRRIIAAEDEAMGIGTRYAANINHLIQSYLPSWTPNIPYHKLSGGLVEDPKNRGGGVMWSKWAAAFGGTDYKGREGRSILLTALDTLAAIKLWKVQPGAAIGKRDWLSSSKAKELQKALDELSDNAGISDEERERRTTKVQELLDRVQERGGHIDASFLEKWGYQGILPVLLGDDPDAAIGQLREEFDRAMSK